MEYSRFIQYSDTEWTSWRLKSPSTAMLNEQVVHANTKGNRAPYQWPVTSLQSVQVSINLLNVNGPKTCQPPCQFLPLVVQLLLKRQSFFRPVLAFWLRTKVSFLWKQNTDYICHKCMIVYDISCGGYEFRFVECTKMRQNWNGNHLGPHKSVPLHWFTGLWYLYPSRDYDTSGKFGDHCLHLDSSNYLTFNEHLDSSALELSAKFWNDAIILSPNPTRFKEIL